jgi:hypothetical protein
VKLGRSDRPYDRRSKEYQGHPFGPRETWSALQIAVDFAYDLNAENCALRRRIAELESEARP